MIRLVIPVLKNTEETTALKNAGLDFDYNDCDTFDVIFYQISAIIKIYENGRYWTEIFIQGDKFISPLDSEVIDKMIQDQFKLSNFIL